LRLTRYFLTSEQGSNNHQQIKLTESDSQIVVMTLIARRSAVGVVAYFSLLIFCLGDEMSAIDLPAKNIQAPIKVNDGRYLLEAATINNRLVPHESIVSIIEIVLLYYPEPHLFLTAITLNVDEESILVRATGSTTATTTEKFL
jgi:hypothetical protein